MRIEPTELCTMVMLRHPTTQQVLVQERTKSWCGLAFPGGHVEPGESFYACALREFAEETGLHLRTLQPCGLMHYAKPGEPRYLVMLYQANEFAGTLRWACPEGRHLWMHWHELTRQTFTNSFAGYLPLFAGQAHEAFCTRQQGGIDHFEYH